MHKGDAKRCVVGWCRVPAREHRHRRGTWEPSCSVLTPLHRWPAATPSRPCTLRPRRTSRTRTNTRTSCRSCSIQPTPSRRGGHMTRCQTGCRPRPSPRWRRCHRGRGGRPPGPAATRAPTGLIFPLLVASYLRRRTTGLRSCLTIKRCCFLFTPGATVPLPTQWLLICPWEHAD